MLLNLFLLLLVSYGLAQMEPMVMTVCSSSLTAPACTLTFTPWMTPQCAPTSTVYENIVTQNWNVVDCTYCTVTNVAHNPAAIGPFNARITKPVLTVSRVGCMPETTAITRRDIRGFENLPSPKFIVPALPPAQPQHRHIPLPNRQVTNGSTFSNYTIPQVSGEAAVLIKELVTAEYSLAMLATPGVDAKALCSTLREAVMLSQASGLNSIDIDPSQAADIICFAAYYGIDLNSTTPQLLGNLTAAVLALDLRGLLNLDADASDFCTVIDYSPLPELGINGDAVSSYICSGTFPTPTSTSASASATLTPATNGTEAAGTWLSGTGPRNTGTDGSVASGTGVPGPYGNSTEIGPPVSATGTAPVPYGNGTYSSGTGSDSWGIDFTSAPLDRRSPPKRRKPNAHGYYPASETSMITKQYRGY